MTLTRRARVGLAGIVAGVAALTILWATSPPSAHDVTWWDATISGGDGAVQVIWGPGRTRWNVHVGDVEATTISDGERVWAAVPGGPDGRWVELLDGTDPAAGARRLLAPLTEPGSYEIPHADLLRLLGPDLEPDRGHFPTPQGTATWTVRAGPDGTLTAHMPDGAAAVLFGPQARGTVTLQPADPVQVPATAGQMSVDQYVAELTGTPAQTPDADQVAAIVRRQQAEHALQTGRFTPSAADLTLPLGPDVSVQLCTTSSGDRWAAWVDVFGEPPRTVTDDHGAAELPCDPLQASGTTAETASDRTVPTP